MNTNYFFPRQVEEGKTDRKNWENPTSFAADIAVCRSLWQTREYRPIPICDRASDAELYSNL
jgi:hypothetical protein